MVEDNKIKNLTDIYDPETVEDEIECGIIAIKNGKYEQAYNHIYKAYKSQRANKEEKGKACFYLAEIMRLCKDEDEFINRLKEDNDELVNRIRVKGNMSEYDARKYLNRKYLLEGANIDNVECMMEYGLNCIGLGNTDAFLFDSNDQNREAAVAWSRRLINKKTTEARIAAYIIYAKYYLYKCTQLPSTYNLSSFCENSIRAYEESSYDQRANLFMGLMCGNEKIKQTSYSNYYNLEESLAYLKESLRLTKGSKYVEPLVLEMAPKTIELYKKNFPNMR